MKTLKVDIYQGGRFTGTLRIKDEWQGLFKIDKEALAAEVERRLPTLKGKRYELVFA